MSDEWRKVRLGDVTSQVQEQVSVETDAEYRLLGVRWYAEGPFHRETVTRQSSKANRLYRVSSGQFIYNRMFAWKGAFGVVPSELDGCYVSNEFPLFACDEAMVLPDYLGLWFQQSWVWDEVGGVSTGTTASRNRWKEAQFNSYEINLPPLPTQRRIVDLFAHLDSHLENLAAERNRVADLLVSLRESMLLGSERRLGDLLLDIHGGRSPMTDGTTPADAEDGVLKVSAVKPGKFDPTESKRLPVGHGLSNDIEVRGGDVLITRANTPDRVGAVCLVPSTVRSGLYLCDKTLRLIPDSEFLDSSFLVETLNSRAAREQLTSAATGTSKSMFNISQAKILGTKIVVPPLEQQRAVAQMLAETRRVADCIDMEDVRLQRLRSCLLTSLLSGSLRLPNTYDALLGEVA